MWSDKNQCPDCGQLKYIYAKKCGSCSKKGRPNVMKGKHYSSEFGLKVSIAKRGRPRCALSEEALAKMGKAHRGKIISKEHKEKLRKAHLGRAPWNKGWKNCHTKETLAKIKIFKPEHVPYSKGKTCLDDFRICGGERHYNWQGGKKTKYPQRWNHHYKEEIRKRDEYKCRQCGARQNGQSLTVHHIDENKQNLCPENLISLCGTCHMKIHRKTLLFNPTMIGTTQTAKALFFGY